MHDNQNMHDGANTSEIPNHAYLIDPNYRLISLDQTTRKLFPNAQIGDCCYEALRGLSRPCDDCPWGTEETSGQNQAFVFNRVLHGWVNLTYLPLELPDYGTCILINAHGIEHVPDLNPSQHPPLNKGADGKKYLDQLLERDTLTGLYTPKAFDKKAEKLIAENQNTAYEILYIDIEHFKVFNERHGRNAGDTILKAVADELIALKNAYTGVVGHVGGDDFIMIMPLGTTEQENVIDRLVAVTKNSKYEIECLPAIGLTAVTDTSIPVSTHCDHAMTAMSAAKSSYSKRIAWYEDTMTRRLEEEPKALLEIESALKNNEFVLHYQPKCNVKTSQMVGLEALVRWQHPERGLVYPGDFIPLMERTGLIANLDLLVWEEACRQVRDWLDRGIPALPISVNISRADLQFIDVIGSLENLIKKYDIDKSYIELEITESAFVEDDTVLQTVIKLSEHGFTLLMDDFGSGYSSLNMLKDIPVDILKIDMRFLELSGDALFRGEGILDAVVGMAHHIGLSVIAEGAETKEQVDFLKTINSDFVQGYFFYRPMSCEKLETLLTQENIIDSRGTDRKHIELLDPIDLIQNFVTNKTILDSILGGVAIYSICEGELEIVQANNRYYQLVGDNPPSNEEDRRNFFKRAPREVVEETSALLLESERYPISGASEEFCQRRADGLYIWVRVKAFYLGEEGDRKIFLGKLTDISAQKGQSSTVLSLSEY